ncbi:MAG: SpoIIE family protein phosphatase [Chlamydiales bacterium]|nr:SpoIIE family protein phosphatase [Chlamydiales bacterium]
MADSRFSDKKVGRLNLKPSGSLARRVLLISLCLIVLPLGIYFLIDFQNNYKERLRDLFLSLDAIGRGEERLLEEFLELKKKNLKTYPLFLDFEHPKPELSSQLQEIAKLQGLSSLFLLTPDGECEFSSDTRMVGGSDLPVSQFDELEERGVYAFLAENPVSKQKEVFVIEPLISADGKERFGTLILGVDAKELLAKIGGLAWIPYPFHLTLLKPGGELFLSSDPAFSMEKIELLLPSDIEEMDEKFFQFAKAEEKSNFFTLLKNRDQKIGLKLPVKGAAFSLLIDLPEKAAFKATSGLLYYRFALIVLFTLLIGGSVTWWLMRRMARPLKVLRVCMERVGDGDLTIRYAHDPLGFEINLLGEQFNAMVDGIVHHIEEVKRVKIGKELLLRELKIGHEIQESIFPKEIPNIQGLEIATGFRPAGQVTGDFYDLFLDSEGDLIVILGDAAGKGIPACLFAFLLRSMLRTAFKTMRAPLNQIIESANSLFCLDTGDSGYFATSWIGKIDLKNQRLHFTSCGHHPLLILRKNGELEELTTPGISLGVESEISVEVSSTPFGPGDLLLMFSDGVIEEHDLNQQLFGKERLRKILAAARSMSASQLIDHVINEVETFSTGTPQHDDLMLLAIKFPL